MDIEYFRKLYAYNRWANDITKNLVLKLSTDELDRDFGASFPTIRATLEHIAKAEWAWMKRLNGISPTAPFDGEKFANLDGFFGKWKSIEEDFHSFLENADDELLNRVVEYRNLAGEPNSRRVSHILAHVVNHGTYHRGQIAAFLRQLGKEAKSTDMIFFENF